MAQGQMQAWRVNELGHPSVSLGLELVDIPSPSDGEVLVRVEAVVVNFADSLLCQGIYQDRPGVPFTPGLEVCGVVEAVGAGVSHSIGERIAGMSALPAGGYGERALIRGWTAVTMPFDIAPEHAAALYSTYQTSHTALHHRGQLAEGEWLLVHGGAGGVGSAAVQLGVAAGARVIATAGGPAKTKVCHDLGAHHVIDYRSQDLVESVLSITDGHGVDVAFDPVGGDVGDQTRRVMAWEGRLVVVGFAAGEVPVYPANHLLVKNYSVIGLHWGAYVEHGGRAVVDRTHRELLQLFRDGRIQPLIADVVGLDGVPGALEALERRQVSGRLIMRP